MNGYERNRIASILLLLGVISLICGGVMRTIHQEGGPLWTDSVADIMWGITMCCLVCSGISIVSERLSEGYRHGWSKLFDILKLTLGIAGVMFGLAIILTSIANLVNSVR